MGRPTFTVFNVYVSILNKVLAADMVVSLVPELARFGFYK